MLREKGLFAGSVLRGEEHVGARPHRHHRREGTPRLGRNVLELERDDVALRRHPREQGGVGVGAHVEAVAVDRGRAVGDIGNRLDAVAHPAGGHREHRTELAAAEDAKRAAREDRGQGAFHGHRSGRAGASPSSDSPSTRAVCAAR